MIRIIGGEHRGRKLATLDGQVTRPTTDRVRESVFNILWPILPDARVLDLFGGSGAMSLEALSRGATEAALCEIDKAAQGVILKNIALCREEKRAMLYPCGYETALAKMRGQFDILFLDPPYRMREAYAAALEKAQCAGRVAPDAVAVLEYATEDQAPTVPEGWEIYDIRKYGASSVAFARRKNENAGDLSGEL